MGREKSISNFHLANIQNILRFFFIDFSIFVRSMDHILMSVSMSQATFPNWYTSWRFGLVFIT
jgi:hypothetical protein